MRLLLFFLHAIAVLAISGNLPAQETPLLRVGLVADPQYCDCEPFIDRHFRLSPQKLGLAVDTFQAWKVDFVVNLGDVIDRDPANFAAILEIYRRLDVPVYHVLGNHDFSEVPEALKPTIPDSLGIPGRYCSLQVAGWRFVFTDGTELGGYTRSAYPEMAAEGDSLWRAVQGTGKAKVWNGGIGAAQRAWIREELTAASALGEKALLFCHFPIAPPEHHDNLWNDRQLLELLSRSSSAVAWLSGHNHGGQYERVQGIHFLTLRGMVMTSYSNAFSILEVYPDRLEIIGFGREPSRTLAADRDECLPDTRLPHRTPAPGTGPGPRPLPRLFSDVWGNTAGRDTVPDTAAHRLPPTHLPQGMYRVTFPAETGIPAARVAVFPVPGSSLAPRPEDR